MAYASRKLTPAETTYSTREQEALAIVSRSRVVTDHRSLSWLMTQPLGKGRLANWAYKLRSYDFSIVYRRGAENHIADLLSRAVLTVVMEEK